MMSVTTNYFFISGCDTTSRVYGIGKVAALKKYANSLHFREQAKVFNSPSTVHDIVIAGENALVFLYGGKPGEKLDGMRYQHSLRIKYSLRIFLRCQQQPGIIA